MANLVEDKKLENGDVVEITVRTIGPSPPSRLTVPSRLNIRELRKLIAETSHLPIEDIKLIFQGDVLHDNINGDELSVRFDNEETVIVSSKPKTIYKPTGDNFDIDDDEDLKFQLPESSSRWKRKLFITLRDKFKLPDLILMVIFSLKLKSWLAIVAWFILAPVSHRMGIGPLYILGTGFIIIFCNLGRRQPGDVSAYSVFNEDFRELPGTLNADHIDGDIRHGRF